MHNDEYWTILWAAGTQSGVQKQGPFHSKSLALAWVREHNGPTTSDKFDLHDQCVYLMDPVHKMQRLTVEMVMRG